MSSLLVPAEVYPNEKPVIAYSSRESTYSKPPLNFVSINSENHPKHPEFSTPSLRRSHGKPHTELTQSPEVLEVCSDGTCQKAEILLVDNNHLLQQDGLRHLDEAYACTEDTANARILVGLLKLHARQHSCSGLRIHASIIQQGLLQTNIFVGCALLNMYAKGGELAKAEQLFDELPVRNIVLWNALIAGYLQHGCFADALSCFECLFFQGISPNAVTLTCVLNACANLKAFHNGQHMHLLAVKAGFLDKDIVLGNAVLDMYAKCGLLIRAEEILQGLPVRDVVSYSALVIGYAQIGEVKKAFRCLDCMQKEGISPNIVTYVGIAKACAKIRATQLGQELHAQLTADDLLDEDISLGTAVVDMYAKCGLLPEAQYVFDEMHIHDVVSWNALIAGYVENENAEKALCRFDQMQADGFSPSPSTFASILKVCKMLGMPGLGQVVHAQIVKIGPSCDQLVVETGLVDMYSNSAMLVEAQEIFDSLPIRSVVSWGALMEGYGQQGKTDKVLNLLDQMMREGIQADSAIVTIILNMCSHGGLLTSAELYFEALHDSNGIFPTSEHYTCMADLLGRAGHVEKAVTLIKEMCFPASLTFWHTLLGACQKWDYVNLGRWSFELAIQLDQKDAETYATMQNIY